MLLGDLFAQTDGCLLYTSTDKVVLEVPAPEAGVLGDILQLSLIHIYHRGFGGIGGGTGMVTNSATFGRSGVHDYILIRATALIMTCYVLYLVGFVAFNDITYEVWTGFFSNTFTKVFTLLTLVCVLIHAWIGLWQVLTDYIKPVGLRGALQFVLVVVLLSLIHI